MKLIRRVSVNFLFILIIGMCWLIEMICGKADWIDPANENDHPHHPQPRKDA